MSTRAARKPSAKPSFKEKRDSNDFDVALNVKPRYKFTPQDMLAGYRSGDISKSELLKFAKRHHARGQVILDGLLKDGRTKVARELFLLRPKLIRGTQSKAFRKWVFEDGIRQYLETVGGDRVSQNAWFELLDFAGALSADEQVKVLEDFDELEAWHLIHAIAEYSKWEAAQWIIENPDSPETALKRVARGLWLYSEKAIPRIKHLYAAVQQHPSSFERDIVCPTCHETHEEPPTCPECLKPHYDFHIEGYEAAIPALVSHVLSGYGRPVGTSPSPMEAFGDHLDIIRCGLAALPRLRKEHIARQGRSKDDDPLWDDDNVGELLAVGTLLLGEAEVSSLVSDAVFSKWHAPIHRPPLDSTFLGMEFDDRGRFRAVRKQLAA